MLIASQLSIMVNRNINIQLSDLHLENPVSVQSWLLNSAQSGLG